MSDKRFRQKTIRFRVSQAEEATIKLHARQSGMSTGSLARHRTLENAKSNPISDETRLLRDCVIGIDAIASVGRKRIVSSSDTERIITELRRLQILLLRFNHAKRQ